MSRRFSRCIRRVDLFVLATGLAAALPVIVSMIRAASAGWLPVGDDAVVVIRSLDVLSTHPPLVGPSSSSGSLIGEAVSSPGPMLFWMLAVPARLGRLAPAIAMGAVNIAAIVATVALARRRGGVPLMLATGAALALMCRSLDAQALHDVWPASAPLLPLALLAFVAWSVAVGEHGLLPLMVVVASFTAQTEVPFLVPAGALAVVALGFLLAARVAVPRRTVAIAVALLAVCWALPLVEEVAHRPGNLELIARVGTADAERFGWKSGWRAVEHAVGVTPWWLREAPAPGAWDRIAEIGYPAGTFRAATTLAVLGALVLALALGVRRGGRDLAAGAALALALCAALAFFTSRTPTERGLFGTVTYTLRWGSVAGMFAWLVLAWVVASLVRPRPRPRLEALRPAAAAAAVGAVAGVGAVAAAAGEPDTFADGYRPLARLLDRVPGALPSGSPIALDAPSRAEAPSLWGEAFDVVSATAYELRRTGVAFVTQDVVGVGHRYTPRRRHYPTLRVVFGGGAPAPGRVVGRAAMSDLARSAAPAKRSHGTIFLTVTP